MPPEVIVATAGVAEDHGVVAFAVSEPDNEVVEPMQIFNVPLIVGNGLTVIVNVFPELTHPFAFVTVIVPV